MKLRKFSFKKVDLLGEKDDSGKPIVIGNLDYRAIAKDIITQPSHGASGFSTDETIKAVMTYGKIAAAFDEGKDHALLDNEGYQFFLSQLKNFRWGRACQEVIDFISYVRSLPEVSVAQVAPPAEEKPSSN